MSTVQSATDQCIPDGATLPELVGAVLRRTRKARGWTPADAASRVGRSQRAVESHERGETAGIPLELYTPIYEMTVREILAQAATIEIKR